MSITFWCPDAPTESYVPYPEQEPEFVMQRSTLPEVNLANSHALALIELMGLSTGEDDYCGSVTVDQLPSVIVRLQRVMQDPVERAAALQPPAVNGVPVVQGVPSLGDLLKLKLAQPTKGPVMYEGGRSDGYVRRQAKALLEVFQSALSHGHVVSWG
jgi:hypothetical protein